MAYIVRLPKLGLEMKEGTVIEWFVDEGESVREGDVLAEIESEKSTAEVAAREDGVLRAVYLEAGDVAEPGTPMGIVAPADADVSDLEAEVEGGAEAVEPAAEPAEGKAAAAEETEPAAKPGAATRTTSGAVKATPPARKLAEEVGVDLQSVTGSGPQGAITEADVQAAAGGGGTEAQSEGRGLTLREERPLSGTRQTIARRLGESYREAVHVTERRTVDAEALLEATETLKTETDENVSVVDVLLFAVSATLSEHPAFNAHFEDDVHRLYDEHNVCIAVDTESGLLAPVVRDVQAASVDELTARRRELTDRVVAGEHTMEDLSGGTFTVTNLGPFGVESFTPIINPPQVAILGVNAIEKRLVPADEGPETRRHLPLNLSFDHRVVDGADAARFLATLAANVEDPWEVVPERVEPATDD